MSRRLLPALRGLLGALATLWLLVTLTFLIMRSAPGGPFDSERSPPREVAERLAAAYHLDEPLVQQYGRYLGGLLRGDLGPSFQYPDRQVAELIAEGLPVSALIGGLALLLALLLGGLIGTVAALHRDRPQDRLLMTLALLGLCLPNFVLAPLLVLLFAIALGWLPAGGWSWQDPRTLVLPVLALALPQIGILARLVRTALLETLHQPFLRTARAKGVPLHRQLRVHALRPVALPVLSYLGPAAAATLTGSVVVEQIFGLPGIGRHFVQAALNRDYTLVLGVVLFYGALVLLFNALVDALYPRLDPRLRRR
ncbi:MAG TPA: ABC transporter permease subunit [Nevskiaceae bacterium]|nr:ABC transporter permease subunit [Nevskiaceae bacterium]